MSDEAEFTRIDDNTRACFQHHGVICLRGAITDEWLACTRAGILRSIDNPGLFFRDQTPEGSPARYLFEYWNWQNIPEFRTLVLESNLVELVAQLFGSTPLSLLMDNWFLREAGATNGAPWHHDEPYFDFEGGQKCVLWFPLEAASREEGLTFLSGSHRWGRLYMPRSFREHRVFDGDMSAYHDTGDLERYADRFLSFDMQPGDCLIFDFRTLHRATSGDVPLKRTIHRMSLRYGDQDVIFKPRGAWTEETSRHLINLGQRPGMPIDCALLPRVGRYKSLRM